MNLISIVDPKNASRRGQFDTVFKIPVSIDVAHHKIHKSDSYTVSATILAGTSVSLAFKIPSGTKRNHITIEWATESKAHLHVYEGRSWLAGSGTTTRIFNRDRNSDNMSQVQDDSGGSFVTNMEMVVNPGTQAGGTTLPIDYSWGTKKEGNKGRAVSEWIYKNDETYVIKLDSDDGSKGLHLTVDWYEHTSE